jgi:hypothetical protein
VCGVLTDPFSWRSVFCFLVIYTVVTILAVVFVVPESPVRTKQRFDVLGSQLDGADYTFRGGLPYATGDDGTPDALEIVAIAPAVLGAEDRWQGRHRRPRDRTRGLVSAMYLDGAPPHLRDRRHGSGMVPNFTRGAGEVFNAGSTEWVNGLIHHDPFTERITPNVLERFAGAEHHADREDQKARENA